MEQGIHCTMAFRAGAGAEGEVKKILHYPMDKGGVKPLIFFYYRRRRHDFSLKTMPYRQFWIVFAIRTHVPIGGLVVSLSDHT